MQCIFASYKRHWLPGLLIAYLVLVLIFSSGLALESWPDNPLRQRLYVVEAERLAILQVTDEGIAALDRALAVAARLPVPDDATPPSRAEIDELVASLAFTRNLQRLDQQDEPSPLRWNRATVAKVVTALGEARKKLEERTPPLLPSKVAAKQSDFFLRIFFPAPPLEFSPTLTSSEQAQVAALLADMNNPRTAAESTTPIARKVRPLLDKVQDTDFILLVLALGAWGASAQSIASIAAYLGFRRFNSSWALFYLTRPLLGATLAFTFYITMRGGLLTRDATWTDINHVGYAAISLLVGFFATEAMENLKRIASGIFTDKDKADGLKSIKPALRELRWVEEGATDYLDLVGEGFAAQAQVLANGRLLHQGVHFVSSQRIRCDAPAGQFTSGGTIQVNNPEANATPSDELRVPALPTAPVIESATRSAALGKLTVAGRRFAKEVAVLVDGVRHPQVTVADPHKIEVDITTTDIPVGAEIRVLNLAGTGGTSNAITVTTK